MLALHLRTSTSIVLPINSPLFRLPKRLPRLACGFSPTTLPHLLSYKHRPSPLLHLEPYLRSEWRAVLKGWICGAVSVLCLSASVPRLSRLPSALASAGPRRLAEAGAPLIALALLRCAASYFQQAFLWEAALGAVREARAEVFAAVVQREIAFFEGAGGVPAGDVSYRITAEASQIADTLFSLLSVAVPDLLQLISMASRMVAVSPVLSLGAVMLVPFLTLAIAYLGVTLHKASKNAQTSVARISAYLNEVFPSLLIVKAFNGEMKEGLLFRRFVEEDFKNLLRKKKMKAFIPQLVHVLYIGGIFLLCVCSILASGGSFDCSKLVSFVASLALLVEPIKGVGKAYNELKQGEPAVERLFDLVKLNPQVSDKPDAIVIEGIKGDIRFTNVSFRYGENEPLVLNELNLHIKPRETVALVGPSGGGKTTLAKLLLRLYVPFTGSICLDNNDIQKMQLRNLRKHIGFVPQDMVIFSGTVAENIAYRDSLGNIDMERVIDAAKSANADVFIRSFPDGYETDVGPKGSRLSGGQRQRLAIARALYQKSSILILDEATSALDSRSEVLVRKALEGLMVDHTILVIAHRVETVLMADRIVLLEGGRLVELSREAFLAGNAHGSILSGTRIP